MTGNRIKLVGLAVAAFVASAVGAHAQGAHPPRTKISINDNWQFYAGDLPEGEVEATTESWQRLNIPHTWNAEDTHDEVPGYRRGVSWYRRELTVPRSLQGKHFYLYFEGVNQTAEVFVDGRRLGSHTGGYSAFTFDVTEALKADSPNSIAVKVDNTLTQDIPPLDADFNMYGGIYRDVWLIATDAVHLSFGESAGPGVTVTTPTVSESEATVRVSAVIANKSNKEKAVTVRTTIFGPDGKRVAEKSTRVRSAVGRDTQVSHDEFHVSAPNLWSPDSPSLYRVVAKLETEGRVVDEVSQPLGFRWYSFDADKGFFLNGKALKLRGTNRHQDHAGLGNAVSDSYHVRDLEIIKANGFNFLRLAHYPQDPAVLEAADRLGIMVWEEIPVVNLIHISPAFNENSKTMLREMIRQHRNHPSVILWGYMNEIFLRAPKTDEITRETAALARELEKICKQEDPTRRTAIAFDQGSAGRYASSGLDTVTDTVGWNLYHGWYSQTFDDFGPFMDAQHARLPLRPLIVSEFGANADRRVHSAEPRRFDSSVEWQQVLHESFLRQIEARQYIAGSAIWNQFDFGAEYRGETIPHLNQKGMYTFDRQPKDISYLYRASYSTNPVLRLALRDRPRRSGSRKQSVKAYTNVSEIELFHNGRSVGKKSGAEIVKVWDVELTAGTNYFYATGVAGGSPISDKAETFYVDPRGTGFIAINVGSNTEVLDGGEVLWQADLPVDGARWTSVDGNAKSVETLGNVLGTLDDPLFQRMKEGDFGYNFNVPDGEYEVDLKFVERTHKAAGLRVFRVLLSHTEPLGPLDLFRDAGFMQSISRKVRVAATNGRGITVRFVPVQGDPVLSGISVRRIS